MLSEVRSSSFVGEPRFFLQLDPLVALLDHEQHAREKLIKRKALVLGTPSTFGASVEAHALYENGEQVLLRKLFLYFQ